MTVFRWADTDAAAIVPLLTPEAAADPERTVRAYAAAVWSCLIEPGDAVAGALIAALGPDVALREILGGARDPSAVDAAALDPPDLRAALGRWRPRLQSEAIAFALDVARTCGARLITPDDPVWPLALADLGPYAPVCLWVRGDCDVLGRLDPAVAIVGARAATGYGEHIAAELAADLAGRGVAVVSGAAYGIDGAAHRAALAAGGTTVAMLAGGVDRPYPAGHADLLRRIAETGVVAAEVPCGWAPTKWRFLQRNRTIAALGGATVVVEAGTRSGSLNTAGHAATLGRPIGAVPGPVTSGSSAGCHRLLREFDARCVTCADEVAELLGLAGDDPAVFSGAHTDDDTRVLDALSTRSARTVEQIAARCGMAVDEVTARLGMMALDGRAQAQGAGWRRAAAAAVG
ncbi:DNA-processing protein DprA [Microbacterium luticocti]|uniref:DNA-processing protein DprA n=1 Tax=Microbacterium luticocti TaxID=451764 RepID=UPI0003FFFAE8|nr:DNA-processing protein DprA [Microbacterium luticocti]